MTTNLDLPKKIQLVNDFIYKFNNLQDIKELMSTDFICQTPLGNFNKDTMLYYQQTFCTSFIPQSFSITGYGKTKK